VLSEYGKALLWIAYVTVFANRSTKEIHTMITKIRHIGIIVDNAYETAEMYKDLLGLNDEDIRFVPPRGNETDTIFAFIPIDDIELELIQPLTESFGNFLGNPREGINHIAFVVDNIEVAVRDMEQQGIHLGHVTRDGILNMKRSRVAYFDPKDTGGMLIEFVEPIE
jgi:methylmalonyl-CoA/ethylmalonyl-CoA epimerase